jgi:hypothetical protein
VPRVLEPKKQLHLWTWSTLFGLFVAGLLILHGAAKASQRERRMVDRIRPVCAHNGFSNEEIHRFVRFTYGAWPTKEEAIHAAILLCRGNASGTPRSRGEG